MYRESLSLVPTGLCVLPRPACHGVSLSSPREIIIQIIIVEIIILITRNNSETLSRPGSGNLVILLRVSRIDRTITFEQ